MHKYVILICCNDYRHLFARVIKNNRWKSVDLCSIKEAVRTFGRA